ncbi:MAG: hypothetical protein JSV84_00240 [Gemmatimonadota bacterium]|nr:MAG: hypothetical protein JSV84_00240 [Gemmatimonadota bacterium]
MSHILHSCKKLLILPQVYHLTNIKIGLLLLFIAAGLTQAQALQKPDTLHRDNRSVRAEFSSYFPFPDPEYEYPLYHDSGFQYSNITFLGEWAWGACHCVSVVVPYAFIGCGSFLQTLDISDPSQPLLVGEIRTRGFVHDIEIVGTYAHVACGLGLEIFDISDPQHAISIEIIDLGNPRILMVSGDYAYLVDVWGFVHIIDISIPESPSRANYFAASDEYPSAMEMIGQYLYLATGALFVDVFDLTDPIHPDWAGLWYSQCLTYDLVDADWHLLAGVWTDPEFRVLDLSKPAWPQEAGSLDVAGDVREIAVKGTYAYLGVEGEDLLVVDISEATDPTVVTQLSKPPWYILPMDFIISGDYAYMAARSGMWVVDISIPDEPLDRAFYATGHLALDVAVSGEYAYVAGGYAGLWVIDISDPFRPHGAGHLGTEKGATDVLVEGSKVYLATHNALLVIDISDPTKPREISQWPAGVDDMVISKGFLFAARRDTGLSIIDVSDPIFPQEVGFFPCQELYHVDVSDGYAYLANSHNGLKVIDVTDPQNPVQVVLWMADFTKGVSVQDTLAYVTANSGLNILNVSDPMNPTPIGYVWVKGINWSIDLNVSNFYVYMNYTSGIRIIDVADPTNPESVGQYGTWDQPDGLAVVDQTIYVTAGNQGLLILNSDLPLGGKGDINRDDTVDVRDVIGIVNIIVRSSPAPTAYEVWAADYNGDGKVNVLDVMGIINSILGRPVIRENTIGNVMVQ